MLTIPVYNGVDHLPGGDIDVSHGVHVVHGDGTMMVHYQDLQ